jgi:hypothetical protein
VTGALSAHVVADFDGHQGTELMKKWGIVPHRRTGSGGFHCHLQHPGWRVPTLNAKSGKLSWPWPGVNIRGDGGFAVVLGRNAKGPYEQLREIVPEPFDVLPEEVRTFLRNHSRKDDPAPRPQNLHQHRTNVGSSRVDSERLVRNALEMVPGQGRNNSGFWLACQLRDNGYSMGEAEAAMSAYHAFLPSTNTKGQREPYTEREMVASLREAFSKPAREPWSRRSTRMLRNAVSAPQPVQAGQVDEHLADGNLRGSETPQPEETVAGHHSLDIYAGHADEPLPGHRGEPLQSNRYSRIPREVLQDRQLSASDVRVYGVLAGSCWQGSVAQLGKRQIARQACCAERKVVESLKRLEAAGHIQKAPGRIRGQRGRYVLLSQVFGQKQRNNVNEVAVRPGGRSYLVSVRQDRN